DYYCAIYHNSAYIF
nr:immunoglobulin light chain junction region [Macaca mulatta]MOW02054.1 immunoglobulin light chain junction region [Macaca mulatta]MOW02107.1 immunoglobulin light chain junction region [Macaca mulatta]MOW02144.1 immunoglobulin light chain junction region [Macaca mulatta]MOW02170.1 immunoglobulin light chain junction region [Macaca mulatta]